MSEGKHLDKKGIKDIIRIKSEITANRYNNKDES